MAFVFLIIGLFLVTAGVRDTQGDLFDVLKLDFTGAGNFFYWTGSILIIGGLGYIRPLQPVSRAFLVLVIVVLFLSNGGFFDKFNLQFGLAKPSKSGATTGTNSNAQINTGTNVGANIP